MNDASSSPSRRYSPRLQLILARIREFYREPEAIFWVYGFPLVMTVALGLAFRSKPVEKVTVDVQAGPRAEEIRQKLEASSKPDLTFDVAINDADECWRRLRIGKIDLVVIPVEKDQFQYQLDKARTESRFARSATDAALHAQPGTAATLEDIEMTEPGSRYIDFLVPGLLGMSIMGGGLWGVGFVIVDMRIRKLLKRFLATPMRRTDFLFSMMLSRLAFLVPEVLILLLFAWGVFGVVIQGNLLALLFIILLGTFSFSGLGLLIASRAKTLEAVSGLMNLIMLPMWLLSGIFFSHERFGEVMQPFIKALPLTALIDALRALMLEGATLSSQWLEISILAAYGVVTFIVALKIFRWN